MSLVYLEDYLDTFESLPDELARNLSQLRELDAESHKATTATTSALSSLLSALPASPSSRKQSLQSIAGLFKETLGYARKKVSLATDTYHLVDVHINVLRVNAAAG